MKASKKRFLLVGVLIIFKTYDWHYSLITQLICKQRKAKKAPRCFKSKWMRFKKDFIFSIFHFKALKSSPAEAMATTFLFSSKIKIAAAAVDETLAYLCHPLRRKSNIFYYFMKHEVTWVREEEWCLFLSV